MSSADPLLAVPGAVESRVGNGLVWAGLRVEA